MGWGLRGAQVLRSRRVDPRAEAYRKALALARDYVDEAAVCTRSVQCACFRCKLHTRQAHTQRSCRFCVHLQSMTLRLSLDKHNIRVTSGQSGATNADGNPSGGRRQRIRRSLASTGSRGRPDKW